MVNEIIMFRLLSGEEVVGKVVKETDTEITIHNPCHLIVQPNEQTAQARLILQLFWQYAQDKDIPFSKSVFVARGKPMLEIKNQWNERFGNGIVQSASNLHKL